MTDCFGGMDPTKQVDTTGTTAPPDWVQSAGQSNYNTAKGILSQGFQPYTGQMTAPLSGNEQTASNLIASTAASPNPYSSTAAADYTTYGNTPGFNYNFNTVADQNGPLGTTQSYMNPYLDAVLAPQLRQLGISGSQARQGIAANATQSGAYGDARHGVVEGEQLKNQALQENDVVGQAYNQAFQQAMSQREQDAGRQFSTQQAQAGENNNTLQRMQQSGIDLTNLDKYDTSRALGLASSLGQTGATERQVQQSSDDAAYQEEMRKQGFTDNQVAFLTSVLKGTPTATTTTGQQTTSQPNNTGWQAIGTLASALFL